MAKVYLDSGDDFIVASRNTVVFGSAGDNDRVTVLADVTGVVVDQNIERVNLGGSSSDYRYQQVGNNLKVFSADGAFLLMTIPLQDDANGTQMSFSDGIVSAKFDTSGGAGLKLNFGGAVVESGTPTKLVPTTISSPDGTTVSSSGKTFTLTTGVDVTMVGGSGDDSFVAVIGTDGAAASGTTLNAGDSLVGGAGNDTLNVSITGTNKVGVTTSGFTMSGVETVSITNFQTDDANDNTLSFALVSGVSKVRLGASASSSTTGGDTFLTSVGQIVTAEMANGASDLGIAYASTVVVGTADTQTLNLSAQTGGEFLVNGIETISINSAGAANTIRVSDAAGSTSTLSTINVTGDKNLTLTEGVTNKLTKVDASTFTGKLTFTTDDSTVIAITGGSADDSFDLGTTFTSADTIDGGAGNDTLTVANTAALAAADFAKVSNVETVKLTGTSASLTLSSNISATTFDLVSSSAAQTLTLASGYTAATTVKVGSGDSVVNSANAALTVSGTDAAIAGSTVTGGTGSDTLQITTSVASPTAIAFASRVTGVESVLIVDAGDSATTGGFDVILDLGSYGTAISIDATALDAANTALPITDETLTVTGGSATKAMTVLGGAGNDSITGGSGNDSLSGGGGADSLVGSAGGDDNISGGDGDDTILMATALTSADTIDGGGGTDTLIVDSGGITPSTVATMFNNVTNVERLALSGTTAVTLNSNLSFNYISLADTGAQAVTLGTGYTQATTVVLGSTGTDSIINSANVALTVVATDAQLNNATAVTGGTGTDSITLTAVTATTTTVSFAGRITGVDSIVIVDSGDSATTAGGDINLDLGSYATSISIDASALDELFSATNPETLTISGASATKNLTVVGGSGNDLITSGSGSDSITGGAGADTITAGGGNDFLSGGDQNDTFVMATNLTYQDTVSGGSGTDTMTLDAGKSDVDFLNVSSVEILSIGTSGTTTLGAFASAAGIATVNGSTGADTINASGMTTGVTFFTGTDTTGDSLTGGSGNDSFIFFGSNLTALDTIAGGAGTDTIMLRNNSDGSATGATAAAVSATISLASTASIENITVSDLVTGGAVSITFAAAYAQTSISVDGSQLDSDEAFTVDASLNASTEKVTVVGGAGDDTIRGGLGADSISGGGGADLIFGGAGADTLTGGSGNDVFNYNGPTDTGAISGSVLASGLPLVTGTSISTIGMDKITDFAVGDTIITNIAGQGNAATLSVSANIDAVWTALEGLVRGNYDATGNTFVVGSTGTSSMYIFDGDGTAGGTLYGIVLIGYTQSAAAGSTTGLIGTGG